MARAHGHDIRGAVGQPSTTDPAALAACLQMYVLANFPVGTKKRISGLRLVACDIDWTHGAGPELSGPGIALLMAITGRTAAGSTSSAVTASRHYEAACRRSRWHDSSRD